MTDTTNYKLKNVDLSKCLVTRDYFNSIYSATSPSYKRNVLWAWGYIPASMSKTGTATAVCDPYTVAPTVLCGMYPTSWKDFHLSSHSVYNNVRLLDDQGKLFLWGCFAGIIWNANGSSGAASFTSPKGSNSAICLECCFAYNKIIKLGNDHSLCHLSYIRTNNDNSDDHANRVWGASNFGMLGNFQTTPAVWPPASTCTPSCATTKISIVCQTCNCIYSSHMTANENLYYWGTDNILANRRSSPVVVPVIGGCVGQVKDYCASRSTVGVVLADIPGQEDSNMLVMMGYNNKGQLGSSTTINRLGYTNTCFANTNPSLSVKSFSLGVCSSFAVASNGTLWAWGDNTYGQLGTNRTVGTSCPIQSIDKNDNWRYVTTNSMGTAVAAIKNDGTLWVWGDVSDVQGSSLASVRRSSPVQVGTKKNWVKVSIQGCRGDLVTPNHMVGITEENI